MSFGPPTRGKLKDLISDYMQFKSKGNVYSIVFGGQHLFAVGSTTFGSMGTPIKSKNLFKLMLSVKKMQILFSETKNKNFESCKLYLQPFIVLEVKFGSAVGPNRENTKQRKPIYFTPFGIQVATFSTKIVSPFCLGCLAVSASICSLSLQPFLLLLFVSVSFSCSQSVPLPCSFSSLTHIVISSFYLSLSIQCHILL